MKIPLIMLIHLIYISCAIASEPTNLGNDKKNLAAIGGKLQISDFKDTRKIRIEIDHTLSEIKKTIGMANCTVNKQCSTVAIGEKACGGPQAFLAYSKDQTDVKKLNTMADKHRQLTKRLNKISRTNSNCMFLSAPNVSCVQNKCKI